jgi:hypothetical protein
MSQIGGDNPHVSMGKCPEQYWEFSIRGRNRNAKRHSSHREVACRLDAVYHLAIYEDVDAV